MEINSLVLKKLSLLWIVLMLMSVQMYSQDTDGDGIPDISDIDDDNDGILDEVENNVIKIDFSFFGDSDGGSLSDWNQITSNSGLSAGTVILHGSGDVIPNINVTITNFQSLNYSNDPNASEWGGLANDPYYIAAADDFYFHASPTQGTITFNGLTPGLLYNVRIYSLIDNSFFGDTWTVTNGAGSESVSNTRDFRWAASTLEDTGTVFNNLSPNASNQLIITLPTDNSSFPLNAIVLEIQKDSDNDGVPDSLDLDSDNDGITDNYEAQTTVGFTAPTGIDMDNDGLDDAYDDNLSGAGNSNGITRTELVNTDAGLTNTDTIPDFLDIDSDNDGIPDNIEAQSTNSYITPNGVSGINGLDSAYESSDSYTETGLSIGLINTDGDSEPDYRDTDSDGDAINDDSEGRTGNPSFMGTDTDSDGLDDGYEGGSVNDGFVVNDGITSPSTAGLIDADADASIGGDVDYRDVLIGQDTDNDGVLNVADLDDDNDGILDVVENLAIKVDFSGAGDADGGSLADWNQIVGNSDIAAGSVILDTSGDVIPGVSITLTNIQAASFNNDANAAGWGGLAADPYYIAAADDIYFHGSAAQGTVTFNGLTPGLLYNVRIYSLINETTTSDTFTVTNGSGTESVTNTRGTRWAASTLEDTGTVFVNLSPNASNQIVVTLPTGTFYPINAIVLEIQRDTDGDGIADSLDLDSDGDGIPDNIEAQATNSYTAPGTFTDANSDGVNDVYAGGLTPVNTDGTDDPDYLDIDSDNDGVFDIDEAGIRLTDNDTDNDGSTDNAVGINGLENGNGLESNDNYNDVNGIAHDGTIFNLLDADNDTDNNGSNALPLVIDLDYRESALGSLIISQIYEDGGNHAIELTNTGANQIPAGQIILNLFTDVSGTPSGSPNGSYPVTNALDSNQSVLIKSVSFENANIINGPVEETSAGITNFDGGNDVIILSLTNDATAWDNRFDVIQSFSNSTSYVRNDNVTIGNITFDASEWTSFVDDNLSTSYNNFQRHPHSPLISEVNNSTANKNMGLGYHRTGATSRSNGFWSNGDPDRSRHIQILEDYNHTGSKLSARQLVVDNNSTLSIIDNLLVVTENINLVNSEDEIRLVDSGGTNPTGTSQLITTHTNSSLISGNGRLLVDQNSDVPSLYRYNYMGSPVNSVGQSTYSLTDVFKYGGNPLSTSGTINSEIALDINFIGGFDGGVTPPTISLAEYWIFTYGSSASWAQTLSSGNIGQADGFIFKGPGQAQNYSFIGTPKDGTIQTNVGADVSYLVGNPYASAINSSKFIQDNLSTITGTLYFWEQKESANGEVDQSGHNFNGYVGGYAIRNLTMGIAANNVTGDNVSTGSAGLGNGPYKEPAAYIPIGQGFFVAGNSTGGILEFNNSQREYIQEGAESVFFRNNNQETQNTNNLSAFKLGMDYLKQDEELELHRQIGISFIEGNTFGFEPGYDSQAFDLGATDIYWDFENDDTPYFIAGVGAFKYDMQIPITLQMEYQGDIKLRIDELDNIESSVYLLDLHTQNSYLLSGESIILTLSPGEYKNRFLIVFQDETLSDQGEFTISQNGTKIYNDRDNEEIVIELNDEGTNIHHASLYNLIGEKVSNWNNINRNRQEKLVKLKLSGREQGLYVLQLKTDHGIINKKILLGY